MTGLPARSEVWWCELPGVARRPVVVLSRTAAVVRLQRALVAPCTTRRRGLPSEVALDPATDPVPVAAVATLDSIQDVPIGTLTERVGRLSHDRMCEICDAVIVAIDCS